MLHLLKGRGTDFFFLIKSILGDPHKSSLVESLRAGSMHSTFLNLLNCFDWEHHQNPEEKWNLRSPWALYSVTNLDIRTSSRKSQCLWSRSGIYACILWEKHVHQIRHILHSCLMWNLFPVKMLDVPKQLIPRTTIHLSLPEIKGVPGTWAISFKTRQTGMSWSFSYPKSAFPHAQPKVSSSLKALRHPRPRCTPN